MTPNVRIVKGCFYWCVFVSRLQIQPTCVADIKRKRNFKILKFFIENAIEINTMNCSRRAYETVNRKISYR